MQYNKEENMNNINIKTSSLYLPEQSMVSSNRFFWSYEITITNEGSKIVQLLSRFWRITDMTGYVEEIHGPGVVGTQPVVKPGKQFTYTSFCQLTTPQGTMEGHYVMQMIDCESQFIIEIPKFVLAAPATITTLFHSKLH